MFHRFSSTLLLPCLLIIGLSLGGCKKDEFRDELIEEGSIYAGEDDRFIRRLNVEGIDSQGSYNDSLAIDAEKGLYIRFNSASAYYHVLNASDAHVNLSFSDPGIEYAMEYVTDSNYVCDHWSVDSVHYHEIYYYRVVRPCNPPELVSSTANNRTIPVHLNLGDPIDHRLQWTQGPVLLAVSSNQVLQTVSNTPFPHYENNSSGGGFAWADGKRSYMAIRWRDGDHYRYGYVELEAGSRGNFRLYSAGVSKK